MEPSAGRRWGDGGALAECCRHPGDLGSGITLGPWSPPVREASEKRWGNVGWAMVGHRHPGSPVARKLGASQLRSPGASAKSGEVQGSPRRTGTGTGQVIEQLLGRMSLILTMETSHLRSWVLYLLELRVAASMADACQDVLRGPAEAGNLWRP